MKGRTSAVHLNNRSCTPREMENIERINKRNKYQDAKYWTINQMLLPSTVGG